VLVAEVKVRAGASLRDSVLWRGAEAGPGCEVEGSVIGPGVRLGRSSVLRNAVLGEGSVVSDFSRTL
jgi:NDP-sugar pyrophosphorylase family protein